MEFFGNSQMLSEVREQIAGFWEIHARYFGLERPTPGSRPRLVRHPRGAGAESPKTNLPSPASWQAEGLTTYQPSPERSAGLGTRPKYKKRAEGPTHFSPEATRLCGTGLQPLPDFSSKHPALRFAPGRAGMNAGHWPAILQLPGNQRASGFHKVPQPT